MIKVLVVDDHPIVVAGLRHLVEDQADIEVAAHAESARDALQQSAAVEADLVVLDFGLPDAHGLQVLQQLKEQAPARPVLILSPWRDPDLAVRAMRAGAAGYLGKESPTDEILEAIRKAAAGQTHVNEWLAGQLSTVGGASAPPHTRLSGREQEVFFLLASGTRSKDIATRLSLSVKTVSTYRSRVLDKLKVSTNAELGVYAVRHGLLDTPPQAVPDDQVTPPSPS
ncbi:MAG: response regulator transcription factor [Vicinamibacterales bacterium]